MEKELVKPIAVTAFFGAVLLVTITFTNFYTFKVQGANDIENRRISLEKDDIIKVKCSDPRAEFDAKEIVYLQSYGLLYEANLKYDILKDSSVSSSKQYADATVLKIEEDLATSGCEEAYKEAANMKDAQTYIYFKSNWKKIMFNKE